MNAYDYRRALGHLLNAAEDLLESNHERTLGSPFFTTGAAFPTAEGRARLSLTDGVLHLEATHKVHGATHMSTADPDSELVEHYLGILGCPNGVLGVGD